MSESRQIFINQVTDLIRNGDTKAALEAIRAYLGDGLSEEQQSLIRLTGRYNRLVKQRTERFIDSEDFQIELGQIDDAILHLLEDLPEPEIVTAPDLDQDFEIPEEVALEKIIGHNNLRQIAWLDQGTMAARSVCRIITPIGSGTGFLVNSNTLMTNNHVLPNSETIKNSRAEFNFQNDLFYQPLQTYRYKLDADRFFTDKDYDFTLVGILPDPGKPPLEDWGHVHIDAVNEPLPNEHVVIIQHPEGGPKQICLTANQVVNVWGHRLQYTTDTMPGSSGAPVFNERWEVIALHRAGGNLKVNPNGERRFINEGILLSFIRQTAGDAWPA